MHTFGATIIFSVVLVVLAAVSQSSAEPTIDEVLDALEARFKANTRRNRQKVAELFTEDADETRDDLLSTDPDNIESFISLARLRLGRVLQLVDGGLWENIHSARVSARKLRDRVAIDVAARGRDNDNALDAYYLGDITKTVKQHAKIVVGAWKGVQAGYLDDLEVTFDEIRRIAADADDFATEVQTLWERTLEVLRVDLDAKYELSNAVRKIVIKRLRKDIDILLR